jgi:hypothetical protein
MALGTTYGTAFGSPKLTQWHDVNVGVGEAHRILVAELAPPQQRRSTTAPNATADVSTAEPRRAPVHRVLEQFWHVNARMRLVNCFDGDRNVRPENLALCAIGCDAVDGGQRIRRNHCAPPAYAASGRLAPLYDFMRNLPDMEGTPVPFLPKQYVERTLWLSTSFDAGRGRPYQCSFCTIINGSATRRHSSAFPLTSLKGRPSSRRVFRHRIS